MLEIADQADFSASGSEATLLQSDLTEVELEKISCGPSPP